MGAVFSCIDDVPTLQRLEYDMTPVKSKSLPIVWLVGPPGSGRNTQAKLMSENLGFSHIKVAELMRNEAKRDTDRARLINEGLHNRNRRLLDTIVVDLIKEEMLRKAANAKGFLINNFPKNSRQASLFVKEIADVDVIIYLICDTSLMLTRKKEKSGGVKTDEEAVRLAINSYMKEVKEGTAKFGSKLEKIRTNDVPVAVYEQIEAAITVRVNNKSKITAESDYAQSQMEEESVAFA